MRMGTQAQGANAREWAAPPSDWAWLVRFCARFTPDRATAEDLAQETLIIAWQHADELRDPAARPAWLAGIARRRCLMWARRRRRDIDHLADTRGLSAASAASLVENIPDDADPELEVERDEVAALLDRALDLLPDETRQAVVWHYVDELPRAELAARLGVSAGAVAARLQRGRLALRQALTTRLAADAATYGLGAPDARGWQQTRLWCPRCGQRHLDGRLDASAGEILLRCPHDACSALSPDLVVEGRWDGLLVGLTAYKPAVSRIMRWVERHGLRALATRVAPCRRCGSDAVVSPGPPAETPWRHGLHGIHARCQACRHVDWYALHDLLLCSAEGQRFWREQPRIHTLPAREVDAAGRAALVTSYQGVTQHARLDIVVARDSYDILDIHRLPRP